MGGNSRGASNHEALRHEIESSDLTIRRGFVQAADIDFGDDAEADPADDREETPQVTVPGIVEEPAQPVDVAADFDRAERAVVEIKWEQAAIVQPLPLTAEEIAQLREALSSDAPHIAAQAKAALFAAGIHEPAGSTTLTGVDELSPFDPASDNRKVRRGSFFANRGRQNRGSHDDGSGKPPVSVQRVNEAGIDLDM